MHHTDELLQDTSCKHPVSKDVVLHGTCIKLGRKIFDTGIGTCFSAVASEHSIHHVAISFHMEKSMATVVLLLPKKGWERTTGFKPVSAISKVGFKVWLACNSSKE